MWTWRVWILVEVESLPYGGEGTVEVVHPAMPCVASLT